MGGISTVKAEAVTVTGVGGGPGIAIGFGVAFLVKAPLSFPVATPIWPVVLAFILSTTVGIAFGLWPALRASRPDPVVAPRYE